MPLIVFAIIPVQSSTHVKGSNHVTLHGVGFTFGVDSIPCSIDLPLAIIAQGDIGTYQLGLIVRCQEAPHKGSVVFAIPAPLVMQISEVPTIHGGRIPPFPVKVPGVHSIEVVCGAECLCQMMFRIRQATGEEI